MAIVWWVLILRCITQTDEEHNELIDVCQEKDHHDDKLMKAMERGI